MGLLDSIGDFFEDNILDPISDVVIDPVVDFVTDDLLGGAVDAIPDIIGAGAQGFFGGQAAEESARGQVRAAEASARGARERQILEDIEAFRRLQANLLFQARQEAQQAEEARSNRIQNAFSSLLETTLRGSENEAAALRAIPSLLGGR